MRRTLIHATLAMTLAATAAFAQQATPAPAAQNPAQNDSQQPADQYSRHHRAFDAHKAAQHMGKQLGLTEDQTAKLEPILSDRQQKMKALRADTSLTEDQRRTQMRSIMKDSQTQLATVLTPDQMQQLKSMRHGGPRGRHQGAPGQQQAPEAQTPPSA